MLDALHLCHRSPNTTNDYLTKETKDSSHQNADCNMKGAGILVVSFGGVNFGFWSHSQTVKDKQRFRFIAVSRRVTIIYLSLA